MATKIARSARASDAQLYSMVRFIEDNKEMAEGRFPIINGNDELWNKWVELSITLNSWKGPSKTVAQWQITWRDLKNRTSQKLKKIRIERNQTGNEARTVSPLTPLELRVIDIMGTNYVGGSLDCPDCFPEQEDIQEQRAAGDSSPLMRPPNVTSISDHLPSSSNADEWEFNLENGLKMNESHIDNPTDREFMEYIHASGIQDVEVMAFSERREEIMEDSRQIQTLTPVSQYKSATAKNSQYPISGVKRKIQNPEQIISHNASTIGPKRFHRESQLNQLCLTRDQFIAISESHSQSMMMLATAAKQHAEAMGQLVKATKKQADAAVQNAANETARIEVMSRLVEVLARFCHLMHRRM